MIDTCLWIEIERGKLSIQDIQAITQQAPVYLSPVNVAELRFGIELMQDGTKKMKALAMMRRLRRKPILRITGGTGEYCALLAASLQKLGRGSDFRIQDLWLAAQAVQRDLVVLTANAKDFQDVPGLRWIEVPIP